MKALLSGFVLIGAVLACAAEAPFVGIELRPLGADIAAYLGVEQGVQVGAVMEKSPAEAAGFKANDVIVAWNGEKVAGPEDVVAKVKAATPGQEVKVKVLRKGAEHELALKVGTREGEAPAAAPVEAPSKAGYLGIAFDATPPVVREYLGLDAATPGVYVVQVMDDSPAAKAGLKERDLILKVNGKHVAGPEEFQAMMSAMHAGAAVAIEGLRAGRELKADATLAPRPAGFEKKLRRPGPPWQMPAPGKESAKDRFTLRFKDWSGKEHVIPFPPFPQGREFNFEMPKIDWPDALNKEQIKDIEARVKEAMEQAMKRLDESTRDLKGKHEAFVKRLEGLKGGGAPGESKSVIVSNSSAQVMSSDGTHEISIKTENDKKTVTVKEGDKVIANDLPFDQIGTLPEAIQKKIKDLDANVIMKFDARAEGMSTPPEEEKEVKLGVPGQTL